MTLPPDATSPNGSPATPGQRHGRTIEAAEVAGVAYAVLAITGLVLLWRTPELSMSSDELTEWYGDTGHQAELIMGLNAVSISAIAFLWFVAVIRRRLGEHEDRFFGTVFIGSSIVFVGIWLVGAAAIAAPAVALNLVDDGSISQASATQSLGVGGGLLLVVAPRLQAVFVLTVSNLIVRSRFLPSWLAYVGFVVGLGMMVTPLVTRPIGIAFPLWVLLVSVVILLARPTARAAKTEVGPEA